jgi:hypothetical protein
MEPVRHFIAKDRLAGDEGIDFAAGKRLKTVLEAVIAGDGNADGSAGAETGREDGTADVSG